MYPQVLMQVCPAEVPRILEAKEAAILLMQKSAVYVVDGAAPGMLQPLSAMLFAARFLDAAEPSSHSRHS